jgi:carotenoid cleavage dioxygenase-like enzyme
VKYDHDTGTRVVYEYEDGWYPSEAPFARSTRGGDEDTGYVTTIATNVYDYRSEAWIFDAKRIMAGPLCRVRIPARVAPGFHASWVPGRDLWGNGAARL